MLRRVVVLALLMGSVAGVRAGEGAESAEAERKEAVERGEAFFRGFTCTRCHTVGGEGGTLAPDLSFVGFRKKPEWLDMWLKNPPAWKHNTVMPNFEFPENVRKDLVAYLSTLKGQAYIANDAPPWNKRSLLAHPVQRGKVIFERAGCRACHGKEGRGGYPNNNVPGEKIPALTFVADGYTKDELRKKIRRGARPMKVDPAGPDPMISMPSWGKILQNDEIDAVVEYLVSLRPAKKDKDDW